MKLLQLEILNCHECPMSILLPLAEGVKSCAHRDFDNHLLWKQCPTKGIPDWCPLPDAKEEK